MNPLAEKFTCLKTSVGGNRERMGYEDTFGMPKEAQLHITPPSPANTRVLGELGFALNLSQAREGRYDPALHMALDYLLGCVAREGVLTNRACEEAEAMLAPMEQAAKEYCLILAAHAHIDMNWMWSYNETVSIVLATFRTILHIMDEYPAFCFSQSQASVYRIVEEYDPPLMAEIQKRIAEGRWEVTATAWVETDKNMPGTESLLRHIQYTREYLRETWGVKHFDLDFSPDTFGHSAQIPELNRFGEVSYYYHCRGLQQDHVLYRWQAPSGHEVLAYREPNWYNGAITPQMGAGLIALSERCAGLKTGLVVYGVGDHGGGPTRRDVERALEMMTWKIYPRIRFGAIRDFFIEAEAVRAALPVVRQELNYFAPGCYTTQSRIKRGNRRVEAALLDADALSLMAEGFAGFPYARKPLRNAWRNVLFTHFHDILTGSCVQDSREYAMGLYQTAMATAATQIQNAMRVIAEQIDTSGIAVETDAYNSQSEGAGSGYGFADFGCAPSAERGSGKTRIFHVFNTLPCRRTEVVPLTVWDWPGDLRDVAMEDEHQAPVACQLLDTALQTYWDHKYFRILAEVTVPAMGYATLVLRQREAPCYRHYFQSSERVSPCFDDLVLENDLLRVVIAADSGRIRSIRQLAGGQEIVAGGSTAGLSAVQTEAATSSAWQIGRYLSQTPVEHCVSMERVADGALRGQVRACYTLAASKAEVTYTLDKHSSALRVDLNIDWHETGGQTVPVLVFRIPLAYPARQYLYDIPGGAIRREPRTNDVPALQYGMGVNESGDSAILISDSKYGFRGTDDSLAITLINASVSPDPYPERGIHHAALWAGIVPAHEKAAAEMADACNHALLYQPAASHRGSLPLQGSLMALHADHVTLTALTKAEDGSLILRFVETEGTKGDARVTFLLPVASAVSVNLLEHEARQPVHVAEREISFQVQPYCLFAVKVRLRAVKQAGDELRLG